MQGGDDMKDKLVRAMIISIIVMLCAGGCILLILGETGIGVFLVVYSLIYAGNINRLAGDEE